MASSLAAQLQTLREGGAGSKQKAVSFLYDSFEAGRIDDETVYNLAWNGLLELKQLDARFEDLSADPAVAQLFSRQRIHFRRAHLSASEEPELDAALTKVLDALSAYFLLGAAHKVLEFLVRRYEIHRYNVDAVMATIVSFHESSWFVRMVRLLHIHNTRWEFLLACKTKGEPLLRAALVQRALDESSVVEFIFNAATRIGAANPKLISLYTLVVLQMLEQGKVREEMLRWLVPQLLTALKATSFPELQSSAYMVVTKLASKAILTEKVVHALTKYLVKYAQPGAQLNALLCVIYLAQTQPSFALSESTGKHLVHLENAADFLRDAAASYESVKFVKLLSTFLVDHIKTVDDDAYFQLLVVLIESLPVMDELVGDLVQQLLEHAQKDKFALDNARVGAISQVLVALSKKSAPKVDAAVNALLSKQEKKTKKDKQLNKFLTSTFENVANSAHFLPSHTDANTSLALALDHPTEHIRYQALMSLAKKHDASVAADAATSKDQVLTSGSVLLRRLLDDSERIATFMVSSTLGDLMLSLCSKKKVFETLVQAVHKWSVRGKAAVVEAVASFALQNFRAAVGSADFDEKLLTVFVSLVSMQTMVVSVETVWSWIVALDHPLGEGAADKADKKTKKTVAALAEVFGHTLADDISGLLPCCLRWSQKTELNDKPMTEFVIAVLSAARTQLASKKTKKMKEQQAVLDQSFRSILKQEFAALCEQNVSEAQTKRAISVASTLVDVARDVFSASRGEFDACVTTLLQSPTPIFIHTQGSLLELFQGSLETELLPTMARLITTPSTPSDVMQILTKTRALDITCAVLEGYAYTETKEDLQQLVHVVPVVLVALSDADKAVRQSAVVCLDRWMTSCGEAVRASKSAELKVLQEAVMFFLEAKEDMLMDASAVTVRCGAYSAQKTSGAFYQLLLDFVSSASTDEAGVAVKLLELLVSVKETSFWVQSADFFQQTLAGYVASGSTPSNSTTKLLAGFLTHYLDPEVAVKTTKGGKASVAKELLDALLVVLQSDKEAVARLQKLQLVALSQLSGTFYEALDDVSSLVLVRKLLRLLMASEEAVASKLIQCLNALPLTYGIFSRMLEEQIVAVRTSEQTDLQELSCVLEVLAVKVDSESSHEEPQAAVSELLKTLCDALGLLCDPKNAAAVSEYLLQVLFSCLRRVCEVSSVSSTAMTSASKAAKHTKASVEPELLVKHTLACLGRTSSPQTRNEALLFVSALVDLHPASVLASLEKILSFVGAGSIRREDEYSFHVLETIIRSVVPHMVASRQQKASEEEELITPQRFIALFVAAFNQIPSNKRESLFQVLVGALGSELLPYCVAALLQRGTMEADMDAQRELVQFAHRLAFSFECTVQVSSLVTLLRVARDLLPLVVDDSDTDTDEMEDEDETEGGHYERFVVAESLAASKTQCRQLNSTLVAFVTAHLRARELHHKILSYERAVELARTNGDEDEEEAGDRLQHEYLLLAQVVLLYFRRMAREQSLHDDTGGFWTALANESIEILGALQQLLSTPGFVAVVSELLHHDNSLVRKKAMQLFNERLQEERESLTAGEELLFVDMLDELDAILQNAEGSETSVNMQTALLSVDILARNFAGAHSKRFQQVLPTVVKYVDVDVATASPTTLHLVGCGFVCLSSICRAVGALVFPLLPKFFPRLLQGVDFCSSPSTGGGMKTVLQCLLAALEVFTDKIPQFLSPYLSAVVRALLTPSLLSSAPSNAQVLMSVDCCLLNLCQHVALRQLLPTLFGAYEHALAQGSDVSVTRLFSVVGTVVGELDAAALRQHLPAFARFFVTALDARRVHSAKLQDLEAVEDEVLECLVQFILKLSEKQLKPLFLKVCEWAQVKLPVAQGKAAADGGDISRHIAFFKLVAKLSERLRGIFVPYYAHVLEFLTAALRDSRAVLMQKPPRESGAADSDEDDEEDDFFANEDEPPAKKARVSASGASSASTAVSSVLAEREQNATLLRAAVRALDGCFVHDSDGFIEKERFELVLTPLVDVLDVLQRDSSLREFVLESVAPCLANLAWAAKSDLLWKPLHYAVLMKSRGDCAAVRLAALVSVEKCYQVIGDEFLAMLPESIPFLAELMEDTDAEVERTCHRVIKQIEDISGESLDQYLMS